MTADRLEMSAPGLAGRAGGLPSGSGPIRRLVPFSGVQFLDIAIGADTLPMLGASYVEEALGANADARRVLLRLDPDGSDGTVYHPISQQPLGPADTLSFTGIEALEPFLDTWVPLPFLRYLGRTPANGATYDQGPVNWARLYIATPAEGLRGADRLAAVLAFDTRLEAGQRSPAGPDLAPTRDDALYAATFDLVTEADRLGGFLGLDWVDQWLRETIAAAERQRTARREDGTGSRFTLAHMARYLALLDVLRRTVALPRVRFVDTVSKGPMPTLDLDLVLDFAGAETTAILVPRDRPLGADITDAAARAFGLQVRDLSRPTVVHTGAIPSVVEFDQQTFGNAGQSRRSGRPDAFAWPSLVRIGREAERLALRTNALDGVTGVTDVATRLTETAASEMVWRFSTPDQGSRKAGPMVAGEALRHVAESGEVLKRASTLAITDASRQTAPPPALRPRFSHSAIAGFFLVELLLQALRDINAPDPDSAYIRDPTDLTTLRRIVRVVIACPLGMPPHERQLLVDRVEGAIDLAWSSQRWDGAGDLPVPPKPPVALWIGPDLGGQLVHLHTEVVARLGGAFGTLVDGLRRRTGEPDARDSLRVASVELGQRTLGLTIADYDVGDDGAVAASVVAADRAVQGGQRIVDALAETVVVEAIVARLAACGLSDPRGFLLEVSDGREETGGLAVPAGLGRRLATKVIRPAARRLLAYHGGQSMRAGHGIDVTRLDALVTAGGGRLEGSADQLEALAAAAGAKGFALADVEVASSRRHLEALFDVELGPAIAAIAEAVRVADCDLLLADGELANLPELLDHLVRHAPVPAGRITVTADRPDAVSRPAAAGAAAIAGAPAARVAALMAAYMAGRGLLRQGTFALSTAGIPGFTSEDKAGEAAPAGTLTIGRSGMGSLGLGSSGLGVSGLDSLALPAPTSRPPGAGPRRADRTAPDWSGPDRTGPDAASDSLADIDIDRSPESRPGGS